VRTAVGLDFSAQAPILVRAARAGRQLRFERLPSLPADRPAFVAASLATHETFVRRLAVPLASADRARKVLPSLLDVQLPFPIEKCVYDFPETAAAGGQTEALAVAARIEDVEAALGRMKTAGFDPLALDHEALALWAQAQEELPATDRSPRAILYIGHDRCALVVGEGSRFLAAHGIRQGAGDLKDEALQGFVARLNQQLRVNLREAADAAFAWALVGPGIDMPGQADAMRRALQRPEGTIFLKFREPGQFLARALAARALRAGPLSCNLRSGALEHPAVVAGRRSAAVRAARWCLAAGLALCALNIGWLMLIKSRDAQAQETLTRLAVELSGLSKVPRGQEVILTQRALDERNERLAPFVEMLAPSATRLVGELLEASIARGVRMTSLSLSRQTVELSGAAPSWEAAEAMSGPLRNHGWRVDLARGEAGADERVPFTARAQK
jgi:hypothetical protein